MPGSRNAAAFGGCVEDKSLQECAQLHRFVARSLCIGLTLLCLPSASPARVQGLDPQRSEVSFSVRLLVFSEVRGSFTVIRGGWKTEDGKVRVCAEAEVDSVRLPDRRDEQTLRGPLFFDAARFPLIHFESGWIDEEVIEQGGELPGLLNLHGVTRPAVFVLAPRVCEREPCALQASAAIRRSHFGMNARRALIGDVVRLRLSIQTCATDQICEPPPGCFGSASP